MNVLYLPQISVSFCLLHVPYLAEPLPFSTSASVFGKQVFYGFLIVLIRVWHEIILWAVQLLELHKCWGCYLTVSVSCLVATGKNSRQIILRRQSRRGR